MSLHALDSGDGIINLPQKILENIFRRLGFEDMKRCKLVFYSMGYAITPSILTAFTIPAGLPDVSSHHKPPS